jgi:hypothetical protein
LSLAVGWLDQVALIISVMYTQPCMLQLSWINSLCVYVPWTTIYLAAEYKLDKASLIAGRYWPMDSLIVVLNYLHGRSKGYCNFYHS